MIDFDEKRTFYLIPKEALDDIIRAVKDLTGIQERLKSGDDEKTLGDYLPENKAMELLDRGKTWFWNKRKSGELLGKKAAGRWYYKKTDITKYINDA